MNRQPIRFVRKRRRFVPDRITLILIVAFVVLGAITAIVAVLWARGMTAGGSTTNIVGSPGGNAANPAKPGASPKSTAEMVLQPQIGPTAAPWDGVSRINILIMGLDYRDWEAGETARTDSIILFTIDPASKTAGMLSIPRDMWVNIPGTGFGKINTAYFIGASQQLPGGGPGLAMKTVQDFIGVSIPYYAQIDFYAFEKFIDAMGGLDMKIRDSITIDPLGPGNTRTLEPGTQTLTGAESLAYARQRYTEGGDFDRANRQQEVIMAIRNQVINFNMLPTLVSKSPELYRDLSSGIHTNLTLQQIIQLAYLAQDIDAKNIKRGVIDQDMVTEETSPEGLSIEKPIPDKIRVLRDKIFDTSIVVKPTATPTKTAKPVVKETAKIQVQNGTQVGGLAVRTTEYLKSMALTVVDPGNADQSYEQTVLIDYTGKPDTTNRLAKLMNIDPANIFSRNDPNAEADIVVILGQDWALKNPMK